VTVQPPSAFQPLSGMDAGFLYMEAPTLHMHTLKVALMAPTGTQDDVSFDGFRHSLESRLDRLPSFRQRLLEIPFGLGHPVWVDDESFDLARHLAHRTAAAPGGTRELNAIVSEIASKPLPRDRPLWEITMVDGLEGRRVAFVCKLHHSMADGAAALAMLLEVLTRPKGEAGPGRLLEIPAPVAARGPRSPAPPTRGQITRWALGQFLRTFATLPRLAWQTVTGLFALARRAVRGPHPHLPGPFSGPRTRWNGALTARRSFGTTSIPLADMKRAKRALGVTLNDVFLGICGGAVRAHLEEVEGAIPERSLVASVPINTRPNMDGRTRGNHVGHITASLCTQIADPIDRVRAIHEMMDEAKQRQMTVGPDLMERWIEFTPPKAHSAVVRLWSRHHVADFVPPPVNLVVSNVPGPRAELSISGYRLEALYSVGPILDGVGLNITGWSYGDRVCFVGLACPDQIPDVQALVDRLPRALEELIAACGSGASGPSAASDPGNGAPEPATRDPLRKDGPQHEGRDEGSSAP